MTKINLNKKQLEIIKNESKHTLVCAGAGTGKTTTIIGKINYLIKEKHIKENEIICISFTNESTNDLKNKLLKYNLNIPCFTFHKLGLKILKNKYNDIIPDNYLEYIINEFFETVPLNNNFYLKTILNYFKTRYNNKTKIKKYEYLKETKLNELKYTIKRFIELLKTNNYNDKIILKLIKEEKNYINKSILIIIYHIYNIYENELNSTESIDFNDMINKSKDYIDKYGISKNIKYLIIDEFQDTSNSKFELIKSIEKSTNCNLFVVGDDFQSIYKFTGCNLDIFLNFKNTFKETNIFKLEETYRNSKELILTSGSFIMKNKRQIKKDLISNKSIKRPIEIIYYKSIIRTFIKLINEIYLKTNKPILILGRNNFDIKEILKSKNFYLENESLIYIKNKNIKMKYLTAHKAKGLEEENVILINLLDNEYGFPSKKKDNYFLNLINIKTNEIKYAEERRLFYVALTRTKNKCYILTKKENKSIFIKELIKKSKKYIRIRTLN